VAGGGGVSARLDAGQGDWLGYLDPVGLVVAPAVLARLGLWPEPQGAADGVAVATALAAGDPWALFGGVLGWPADRVAGAPGGAPLPGELSVSLRDGETLLEPTWAVLSPPQAGLGRGTSEAGGGGRSEAEAGTDPSTIAARRSPSPSELGEDYQLLVRIEAPGTDLDRRGALDGWEATPQQRFERLLRETGVGAGVLVGAQATGRTDAPAEPVLRLVVAPRGEASGQLTWPLEALASVGGRGMLGGLKLLLDRHALVTGAPSHRLTTLLAESRAAQAEVSTRLAGQVLASLHELLRGLDAAEPDLVRPLAAARPQHLYEGLLTVLLRLIFILYAEDRGLMPASGAQGAAALYEQGYALGGLHARLLDAAALHADVMDERRGAWGQLLALFGLVEHGHDGFMQARGGELFDAGAFPFLLGRHDAGDAARVLPVSDGCVLRVLDGLLMLGGERVAYRALSVEQIGSVYETVMGFTAEVARGSALAIRAGKNNKVPVWVDLAELAALPGPERVKWLKERTGRGTFGAAVTKALKAAAGVAELAAALGPVVDARACPQGRVAEAGTPLLQPTDERRRTGSHYTPASLTGPIVRHALEPAFARLGADATPAAILDLKVCDPAAGSGAFLVEACRQLGARLVEAWDRWPAQRPTIPRDEDDLLHAKRLVAQHCLHGVDRNPLAIGLAKLSLWLETLASEHQFTFLDHVLRFGDSLVGLPNPKITAVSWGKTQAQHTFVEQIVQRGVRAAAEARRLVRAEAEIASYAVQQRRQREAEKELRLAHLVADAVLEAFFAGSNAREREANLGEVQQLVLAPSPASWVALEGLAGRLRASPIGIASFHWELEFEDVFSRANPGFDAIVGNPPFAGKNTIASGHHTSYPDWLKTLHPGAHGNADLSAHFFRRAFALLRRGGAFGLIATNTIRQGDTRETGLAKIVAEGGVITRAVTRHRWEGEAAVVVSQVFVRKGGERAGDAAAILDGKPVRRISAYLVEGDLDGSPAALRANAGKAFAGFELYSMGFTFDDDNAARGRASPLSLLDALVAADPRNRDVVKPYLGGEEVNTSPTHAPRRYTIDFADWPLQRTELGTSWFALNGAARARQLRSGDVAFDYPHAVAADWPDLLALVRQLVKPEREQQDRARRAELWWQFGEVAPNLRIGLDEIGAGSCLVTNRGASPHLAIAMVPATICLAKTLAVFTLSTHAAFASLQSRVHEVWTRFFASTLEDRLRYTPSDCFETFPLPPGYADAPDLDAAGQAYHDHRAALMIARDQGMTPTYNRFHTAADQADDIAELRRLHAVMDGAVLRAYGWDDLAERAVPEHLAEDEPDHQYRGRLHWPAAFRDELLARLLLLNRERAVAEARP
jgi:hypothetical protein